MRSRSACCPGTSTNTLGYFQPTFLYEALWDFALAIALVFVARRWTLGRGNTFALYAMGYTAGRAWIEALRSDYAHRFLGLRLNEWTAAVVFVGALIWFLVHRDRPDTSLYTGPRAAAVEPEEEPVLLDP